MATHVLPPEKVNQTVSIYDLFSLATSPADTGARYSHAHRRRQEIPTNSSLFSRTEGAAQSHFEIRSTTIICRVRTLVTPSIASLIIYIVHTLRSPSRFARVVLAGVACLSAIGRRKCPLVLFAFKSGATRRSHSRRTRRTHPPPWRRYVTRAEAGWRSTRVCRSGVHWLPARAADLTRIPRPVFVL